MKTSISLNHEQRLFVISTGSGYSCLGFDVVYAQACELEKRLRARDVPVSLLAPKQEDIGTLKQYEQYQKLFGLYSKADDITTWYDGRTPAAVQVALENLRKSRHRARVFYGDVETGRSWLDENDVVGRLSRSSGPMKVPLLMVDALGGTALLTHCIVRLIDVTTGQEVYRHPAFHLPKLELGEAASYDKPLGFTHAVKVEARTGEMDLAANFRSKQAAENWLAFMAGEVHCLRPEPKALAA